MLIVLISNTESSVVMFIGHIVNDTRYFDIEEDSGKIVPLRVLSRQEQHSFLLRVKVSHYMTLVTLVCYINDKYNNTHSYIDDILP